MTPIHDLRLVAGDLSVHVRIRQIRGRWIASADTPKGPSIGVSWFPCDALVAALEPFDGLVYELMSTAPHHLVGD